MKLGGYDSKFEVAEDYELYYRISRIGKITNIDLPLLRLRKNENNISKRSSTQTLNTLIARKAYVQNKTLKTVPNELYDKLKIKIEDSLKFKILVYLNSKIIDHKQENILNILLNLFRKIIIFFINN